MECAESIQGTPLPTLLAPFAPSHPVSQLFHPPPPPTAPLPPPAGPPSLPKADGNCHAVHHRLRRGGSSVIRARDPSADTQISTIIICFDLGVFHVTSELTRAKLYGASCSHFAPGRMSAGTPSRADTYDGMRIILS
jgi:hypothetical protein